MITPFASNVSQLPAILVDVIPPIKSPKKYCLRQRICDKMLKRTQNYTHPKSFKHSGPFPINDEAILKPTGFKGPTALVLDTRATPH